MTVKKAIKQRVEKLIQGDILTFMKSSSDYLNHDVVLDVSLYYFFNTTIV